LDDGGLSRIVCGRRSLFDRANGIRNQVSQYSITSALQFADLIFFVLL